MTMEIQDNQPNEGTASLTDDKNNNDNNNTIQSKPREDLNGNDQVKESSEMSSDLKDKEDSNAMEEDKEEVLDLGDTSKYDINERNALFQRGLSYEKKGKQELALQCYLGCMKGLERKTKFVLLPECLHNVADIYQAQGNYERAIHFAQAEKLFYESALIESEEIQKKIEEIAGKDDHRPAEDLNELNIEAMRAEEYEHLARLCLDNNQPQLALEYAGKCAKIRQHVYGDNHAKTKETLDLFASLYAEVGKEQYSDSFTLLDNITAEEYEAPEVVMTPSPGGEPVSILRQRSTAANKSDDGTPRQTEREKKQVRFHESVEEAQRNKEEIASLTVTLLMLLVCIIILIALGLWLYCSLDRSQTCHHVSSKLQSWIMNIRYYFHKRATPPNVAFTR